MSQELLIPLDLGFVEKKVEVPMDSHPDVPALTESAFLMLAVQNGLETCQEPLPLRRWDHLALLRAEPNLCRAMVVKAKSLLCMLELHAVSLVCGSSMLIAKVQWVLQQGNCSDPA